jgi:hypothetical protein
MNATAADRSDPLVEPAPRRAGRAPWRLLLSLGLSLILPLVVYQLVRPRVGSDVEALAIGAGVSALGALIRSIWRRRIDPLGALSLAGFAIGLLIAALTGGNKIALEVREPLLLGIVGLAGLISLAMPTPLHLVARRALARRDPAARFRLDDPAGRRMSIVVTTIIGVTLVLRGVVLITLAVTVPTSCYLVVGKLIGWAIVAAGGLVLLWHRHRLLAGRSID